MKNAKLLCITLSLISLAISCGTVKNSVIPKMNNTIDLPPKKGILSKDEINNWAHADFQRDTIPGMGLDKAYKFLEGKKGIPVIVGVRDSGIDIEHEDLKDNLWVNTKKIHLQ